MGNTPTLIINNRKVMIRGERNLLEVARAAGIDIPTFCYHSELSIYGACRLCLVDIEGRGIVASCSVAPEANMVVRTHTEEIRELRRISLELLLANHESSCTTCAKSSACRLQSLARRLGVDHVRFQRTQKQRPVDRSSPSLLRDPNKCILCGDCVRACSEIQAVGAIDFIHRGAETTVGPAFGKQLSEGECVNCGLCATVCPTGALTPRSEIDAVWHALNDPTKTVVAQIAPAVRVGIGEAFGLEPGSIETGRLVAAMKALGFAQVYDTSFAADLTVIEEATEFLQRKAAGERLPQFTSCCPAWVKFAEQFCPEVLPNLSSCRSPQQMFGALARTTLPELLDVEPENLVIVSVMPCTAKKYEAKLPKFQTNGQPDVDHVLTTQELALMIEDAGLQFRQLAPESLDMPLGFKTGAGVIFGASGGVTEAVLRFAVEKVTGVRLTRVDFEEVRGERDVRKATITAGDTTLKLAMVHGLRNAQNLADKVARGEADYDLIEVMACPGGCIGGAGQPIPRELQTRTRRTAGLYEADKMLQLHKPQENHFVAECYDKVLGEVGGHRAHELLHTTYQNRRRIHSAGLTVLGTKGDSKVKVNVCLGTGCFLRGAHGLLNGLTERINQHGLAEDVQVSATFCFEACDKGPTVRLGTKTLHRCTLDGAWEAVLQEVKAVPTA